MSVRNENGIGYTGFETTSISDINRDHIASTTRLVNEPGSVEHLRLVGAQNLARERGSVSWDDCSEEVIEDAENVELAMPDLALSEYLRLSDSSGCFPFVSLLGRLWSSSGTKKQE